jgi:hypothetical protein
MTRLSAVLVLVLASSCSKEPEPTASTPAPTVYEPKLTAELVPPAAKGLVLSKSSDADVIAAFGAGETLKDKSIGGTIVVEYNKKPAMHIDLPAKDDMLGGEAWLVPDDAGTPRLSRLELRLKTPGTCAWLETNVGKFDATKWRPGSNRKYGKDGRGIDYTAGSPDGTQPAGLECHPVTHEGVAYESLAYSLETPDGRSMMMNKNP